MCTSLIGTSLYVYPGISSYFNVSVSFFFFFSRWVSWKGTSALTQGSDPSSAVCAAMLAETLTSWRDTWGHIQVTHALRLLAKTWFNPSLRRVTHLLISLFLLQARSRTSATSAMPVSHRAAPWRCISCRNTRRTWPSSTAHTVILSSHARVTLVSYELSFLLKTTRH